MDALRSSPRWGSHGTGRLHYAALLAIIATLYVAAAKLGLSIAFVHPSATPVWPPTGIVLATLLVLGVRFWPAILIGALLANVGITGQRAFPEGLVFARLRKPFAVERLIGLLEEFVAR